MSASPLPVPAFGLGTVPLGNYRRAISDADADELIAHSLDAGIRSFDTAPLYGSGLAETRLGRALRGVPRDELVVSTKVGRLLSAEAPPDPTLLDGGRPIYRDVPALNPYYDFSADGVRRCMEQSLLRLRMDRVDIVHLHDPQGHEDAVIGSAFPALAELRDQGVCAAIGAGSTDVDVLVRLVEELPLDCVLLASRWTLLDRSAGARLLPLCRERGVTVLACGVFNSGVLADPRPGAMYDYRTADDAVLARARTIAAAAARYDVPLTALATQFPLRHPAVAGVVVGAQTVAELDEDLLAFRRPVPDELWRTLDG